MAKDKFQQVMLIGIGIMVAIGFSGVFTYSNLVQSPESENNNNNDGQEFNASLPSENYINESFNLSLTEQANLATQNQVVFVNVLYNEEKTNHSQISRIPSRFNNTVYINSVNTSESTFATGINVQPPTALIIGDQPRTRQLTVNSLIRTSEITEQDITSTICQSINTNRVNQFGATCYT